jgi:hypothetical protein
MSTTVPSADTSPAPTPTMSPAIQTHLAPPRPLQGRFDQKQKKFLNSHLPAYHEYYKSQAEKGTGVRGIRGIKGNKREWVLNNVYPDFAREFKSDGPEGPNIASLKDVSFTCLQL